MLKADYFAKPVPVPVFVAGPSGVGKTTAINALLECESGFARPRSFTSRARRPGETEAEYSFVDRSRFEDMLRDGIVPTVDDVYGNLYAMETNSIRELLDAGRYPIKEIHPKNFAKLRSHFPQMISVVMLPLEKEHSLRATLRGDGRYEEDADFYGRTSPYEYDIPLFVGEADSPQEIAACLAKKVRLYSAGLNYLPRTPEMYRANRTGYEAISLEFTEAKRVTTRNFHKLSLGFFRAAVKTHVTDGAICLEIGPGQGWLRRSVPLPEVSYTVLDLCPSMLEFHTDCGVIEGDVSGIPLERGSCDVVLASLADPFCHPLGLTEIHRVLVREGILVLSIPAAAWATTLRGEEDGLTTTFIADNGARVAVYSFTYAPADFTRVAALCGFRCLQHREMKGGEIPADEEISPAITLAASRAGLSLAELPVMDCYILAKEDPV